MIRDLILIGRQKNQFYPGGIAAIVVPKLKDRQPSYSMKILLVSYKYAYDRNWKKLRELTGNYCLHLSLAEIAEPRGHSVDVFFFDDAILSYGREEARARLWKYILTNKPDVCLAGFNEYDWGEELFKKMRDQQFTTFVFIGDDDTWRWERVSRHFSKYFTWILTYDSRAIKKYKSIDARILSIISPE